MTRSLVLLLMALLVSRLTMYVYFRVFLILDVPQYWEGIIVKLWVQVKHKVIRMIVLGHIKLYLIKTININ